MENQRLSSIFKFGTEGLKAAVKLNQGPSMPWVGLGVFQMDDAAAERAVRSAIDQGYRSIDTASVYGNEKGVGAAVRACGVPRNELFITTKLWNNDMREDRCEAAFAESLDRLGMDYVDLYLLHWPVKGKIVRSWKALEKIHTQGRARAIGISNFMIIHLEELLPTVQAIPAVNQVEFHPYLQSRPLVEFCRTRGIAVEAWSPLMQAGSILRDPVLSGIARAHGKSVAQVILRWDVQSGVVTIPKSSKPGRIGENAGIFDFALSDDEMAAINALDRNKRNGADPFNFNF